MGKLLLGLLLLLSAAGSADAAVPVSGRILGADGTPVPAGTVELRRLDAGPFVEPARRAPFADGRFALTAPSTGLWRLTVRAPGHVPASATLEPLLHPTALPPVVLPQDASASVEVVDEVDRPIVGAEVRVTAGLGRWWPRQNLPAWLPATRSAVTDESGRAVLPRGDGEAPTYAAWIEGRTLSWSPADAASAVRLVLLPAAERPWTVVDGRGRGVADVDLVWDPGSWRLGPSDDEGRLPSFAVSDGARARLETADGRRQPGRRVAGPPVAGRPDAAVFTLEEQTPIRGRVVSAVDGEPLAGAWVWRPERAHEAARTDENGDFVLFAEPGEGAGSARLELGAEGFLRRRALVETGSTDEPPSLIAMEPASALAGLVVDAEGLPQADVTVEAAARARRQKVTTYTDAAGRFYVGGLEPGVEHSLDLVRDDLRHLEYAAAPLKPFAVRRGLRLVMDAAALLVGRVVSVENRPLSDATVSLDGSVQRRSGDLQPAEVGGDEDTLETITGADGRFAVTLTRDGLLDLEVRRPGFAVLELEAVPVSSLEGRFDLGDLVLEPSAPVLGEVRDRSGEPVAGAGVYEFPRGFERWDELSLYLRFRRASATSGADGRFALDGRHAGDTFDLVVRSRGHAPAIVPGVTAPTDEPVRVILEPAARVAGRVVDAEGIGVRNADVRLRRPFAVDAGGRAKARTDGDGAFRFDDVALGEAELWIRTGRHPEVREPITVTEDLDDLRVELPTGFVLSGTVVDPDGLPVRGAAIELGRPVPGSEEVRRSRYRDATAVDGRFRIEGVGAGPWILRVSREWFDVDRRIEVDGDLELELVLDDPGEPLLGVVVDRGGQGLDGVRLQLITDDGRSRSTVSKTGGAFRFPRVDGGRWRLKTDRSSRRVGLPVALLADPGPIELDGDPDTPEPALEIVVGVGATLRGRVLGLPVQDLPQIQISATGERAVYERGRIQVDADGRFEIDQLGLGRWRIVAEVPGTGRRAAGEIEIAPESLEARLDLDFGEGLSLHGTVMADGEPLSGVTVTVTDALGLETRARTDLDGRFRFTGLRSGPTRVAVRVDDAGEPVARELDLSADTEIVLDLLE